MVVKNRIEREHMKIYVGLDEARNVSALSTFATEFTKIELENEAVETLTDLDGFYISGDKLMYSKELSDSKKLARKELEDKKKAEEMLENLKTKELLDGLSDDNAVLVMALFPVWETKTKYKTGDRIRYEDGFYKVLQNHTSQDDWLPTTASSLYVMISDPSEEYPEFKQPTGAHDVYMTGDKVTFEGKHYICLKDNTAHSPKDLPNAWKEEGENNEQV